MPFFKYLIFFIPALILSFFDLKYKFIPLSVIFLQGCFLLLENFLFEKNIFCIYSALLIFAVFMLIRFFSKGIGMGDVYFSFICGLCVPLPKIFYAMIFASLLGIFFIFLLDKFKKIKLPFIPFMTLGTYFSLFVLP